MLTPSLGVVSPTNISVWSLFHLGPTIPLPHSCWAMLEQTPGSHQLSSQYSHVWHDNPAITKQHICAWSHEIRRELRGLLPSMS